MMELRPDDAADVLFPTGFELPAGVAKVHAERVAQALKDYEDDRVNKKQQPPDLLTFDLDEPEPVPMSAPLPPVVEAAPVIDVVVPARTTVQPKMPTTMQPMALVFLDDPIARRLAVAWPACGGDEESWFEAAGFSRGNLDCTRMAKALKVNGICRAGGETDMRAIQYIQVIIAKPLQAGQKKERK